MMFDSQKSEIMNYKIFYKAASAIALIAATSLSSCKKDDMDSNYYSAYGQATADETYNDAQNIADEAAQSGSVSYKDEDANALTGCAVVTRDTVSVPHVTTIDFGSGCTGADGRTRSGQIIVTYDGPYRNPGTTINISFNNCFVDGNQVLGTKTIVNGGINSSGHLFFNVSVNGSIVLANGSGTITWTSERVREWIAGENTPNRDDDQYSITGSANGVAANGDEFSASIISPLIRNLAPGCRRHFVSGKVLLERTNRPDRELNFGNGNCDNEATVTVNGHSHTILLK